MAGQFEKLIGIMKQSMYKAIGNGQLRWYELEEVILDVETTLNNRPLGYVEDDIYMPVLTPQPYAIWTAKPNSLRRTNQRWRLWPQKTRQVSKEL